MAVGRPLSGDELLFTVTEAVLERGPVVKGTRSAFQDAMEHQVIDAVQCLSGGTVTSFISDSRVGPDIEVELFMLAPAKSPAEQLPE